MRVVTPPSSLPVTVFVIVMPEDAAPSFANVHSAFSKGVALLVSDPHSEVAMMERCRGILSLSLVLVVLRHHPWFTFCVALTAAPLVLVAITSAMRPNAAWLSCFNIVR